MKKRMSFICGIVVGITIALASCAQPTNTYAEPAYDQSVDYEAYMIALFEIETAEYDYNPEEAISIIDNYISEEIPDVSLNDAKEALKNLDNYYRTILSATNSVY